MCEFPGIRAVLWPSMSLRTRSSNGRAPGAYPGAALRAGAPHRINSLRVHCAFGNEGERRRAPTTRVTTRECSLKTEEVPCVRALAWRAGVARQTLVGRALGAGGSPTSAAEGSIPSRPASALPRSFRGRTSRCLREDRSSILLRGATPHSLSGKPRKGRSS